MKPFVCTVVISIALFMLVGCGAVRVASEDAVHTAAAGMSASRATTPPGYRAVDQDLPGDDDSQPNDDELVWDYGRAATPGERAAILPAVKRYYTWAVAGNATAACSAVVSELARHPNRVRAVPRDRFRHPEMRRVAGESCVRIATRLFRRDRARLRSEVATLQVLTVRVHGRHGVELVGSSTAPERWTPLTREHGAWRVASLVDQELP